MTRLPVPIEWAATCLATLIAQVDAEKGDLSASLIEAFGDAKADLQYTVDRRQAVAAQLQATIKAAKAYRDEVDDYIDRLYRLEDALEKDAMRGLEVLPEDVEVRGSSGRKLYAAKSQAKLKLAFDVKEKRTFTNLVDPVTVQVLDIDPKYVNEIRALCLNTDAVKKDLKSGVKLDWASLEENKHIRGLFPPEKKGEDDV